MKIHFSCVLLYRRGSDKKKVVDWTMLKGDTHEKIVANRDNIRTALRNSGMTKEEIGEESMWAIKDFWLLKEIGK